MRLSQQLISELKLILKNEYGLNYTDEEVQQAGIAILRFALAKKLKERTKNKPVQQIRKEL